MLLGLELSNHVLSYLSTGVIIIDDCIIFEHGKTDFNEKQMAIITYLSGYIIGTFYRRL